MSRVWTVLEAVSEALDDANERESFDFANAFLDALSERGFEVTRAEQ